MSGIQMLRRERLQPSRELRVARRAGGGERHRPDLPLTQARCAGWGQHAAEIELQVARITRQRLTDALEGTHLRLP